MGRPALPIGANCVWYRHGDLASQPVAAMVTSTDPSGRLKLVMFEQGNRPVSCHGMAVPHKDDPAVKNQPPDALRRTGVWDFAEQWTEYPDAPKDEQAEKARELDRRKLEAMVTEMYEEKGDGSSVEIAKAMTHICGEEWSHQKVTGIILNYKRLLERKKKKELETSGA